MAHSHKFQAHPYIQFRHSTRAFQRLTHGGTARSQPPTAAQHRGGHHPTHNPQPPPPPPQSWSVPSLCAAYGWPTDAAGGGVIAIIELGGGWNAQDVAQAFAAMGVPAPNITDVSVDGTQNSPGSDADGEVALDIQVAGAAYATATGEAATIRMYWAQDITAAIEKASADGCDVCSISWGSDEANWGAEAGEALEAAAAAATAAGMVIFAASGDNDSSDGGDTPANVDLPASAPHVIGCGGTSKSQGGPEVVWNNNPGNSDGEGTGGGFSTMFPVETWMTGAPTPPHGLGRMVPDVAACADPMTGYNIVLNGSTQVVGGTSAVAPLYSGLFAAFGNKLGFISPKLWASPTAFNDITTGNNGTYDAAVGPDPCTGLGSPQATALEMVFVQPPAPPVTPTS
jgi:kumamolisin